MGRDLNNVLRHVQDREEHQHLMDADLRHRFRAFGYVLLFGVLVSGATAAFMLKSGWAGVLLSLGALIILGVWDHANVRSITLAKEQDRRYFLASIRNSSSIEELQSAGLFAYLPSDEALGRANMEREIGKLRRALEVEPEWLKPAGTSSYPRANASASSS
jgi:hypothetical protein